MKEACWNNRPAYEVVCRDAVSKSRDNTYPMPEFLRRDVLNRMQAKKLTTANGEVRGASRNGEASSAEGATSTVVLGDGG